MSTKYRPLSDVKHDFKLRGIKARYITRRRLSRLPQATYRAVLRLVDNLSHETRIKRLKIDHPQNLSQKTIEEIPVAEVGDNFIGGKTLDILDLRGIEIFWMSKKAEAAKQKFLNKVPKEILSDDKVRRLLEIIREERTVFENLVRDPEATLETLFKSLIHGVEKFRSLGFHATIFRPAGEKGKAPKGCLWQEFYRAERWGEGSYSEPRMPEDTLLSVIKSRKARFKVSLGNRYSFIDQGLIPNDEKIKSDLKDSKGSPEFLIFRLESISRSPEAVIYINNRVSKKKLERPSQHLFPPNDAEVIEEQLISYFNTVTQAFNTIRERERRRHPELNGQKVLLTPLEKFSILNQGQFLTHRGQRIRLFEAPSEKFFKNITGVVNWLREAILSVYEGTEIAKGKSMRELVKILSLEDEKMYERVIYTRYLALVEGDAPNEDELKGVVSGTVLDINSGGPGVVFKVPEAMIKRFARGRKLQVALTYEMVLRVFRKRWAEMGFIKGFFHMFRKGIPFYATTQSLRVVKDMLRLKDLSVLRVARGKELSADQRKVIDVGSKGKADERGIELEAYGGRVAIDEEEKGIVLRKPFFFFRLPLIRWLFHPYLNKVEKENQKIKNLFAKDLGINGRIHLVGFFTIGVAIKVGLELAWNTLSRWFSKNPSFTS